MLNWPKTSVTQCLSIHYPIIQAPMAGGATTPALIAAVSNAGGLGSLGAGYLSAADIKVAIQKIRALTKQPFAVNLFIPESSQASAEQIEKACAQIERACPELNIKIMPPEKPYVPNFDEQLQIILDDKVPVLSFTFGLLDANWIEKLKNNNTVLIGTATNIAEAKILAAQDIDIIVAQGSEAGGHRGTFIGIAEQSLIPLHQLIPELVNTIKIPVIAAGGIMNGQDIVTVLKLGASAVQLGTTFLTCPEAGINADYKNTLLKSKHDQTILTRAFSGKLARGIQNKFIQRMTDKDILAYPIQNALTRTMRQAAQLQQQTDFMSMWAGQKAYLSRDLSASELVQQLIEEVNALFQAT